MRWLVLLYDSNHDEYQEAIETVRHLRVDGHILWFGPTLQSDALLLECSSKTGVQRVLDSVRCSGSDSIIGILKRFAWALPMGTYNAFVTCGHSSGFVLGRWRTKRPPFCTLRELCDILIRPSGASLAVLDSCYGGTLAALYELPPNVLHAVGSPPDCPPQRLLDMPVMRSTEHRPRGMLQLVSVLLCQYLRATRKRHSRAMMYFDLRSVRTLAPLVAQHWHQLVFEHGKHISYDDQVLYDLYDAAAQLPWMQELVIEASHRVACPSAHEHHHKRTRVHGMSVEMRAPRRCAAEYKQTRWYRLQQQWTARTATTDGCGRC